jgi:phosphopantothenoylcysteine synthetase/decarboxylase
MKILVTAGNSQVPLDRVRCITNIFTGRTGAHIAIHARERGHNVTLLTSHPETVPESPTASAWSVRSYRTFADLQQALEHAARTEHYDAIIHCAAVSDYEAAGIYAAAPGTRFDVERRHWDNPTGGRATLADRPAGKVRSSEPELWLRLVRTPKLIDLLRQDWGYRGLLVKFKLEVDVSDAQLLEIAERSRQQSGAELMVANTLEGKTDWAFLGPLNGVYERVSRPDLPARLLGETERIYRERSHG